MREAYFREVQNLRQQLHQKQQAEAQNAGHVIFLWSKKTFDDFATTSVCCQEQGDSFIPDSVDLYHTNKEDRLKFETSYAMCFSV